MVEAISITRGCVLCIIREFVVPDCCHRVRVPRLNRFFGFLGFFGGVFHDKFYFSCHLIRYSIMKSGFSLSLDSHATELAVIMAGIQRLSPLRQQIDPDKNPGLAFRRSAVALLLRSSSWAAP